MNQTFYGATGPHCFGTAEKIPMEDIQTPDYPGAGKYQNYRFNKTNPPSWRIGKDTQRNGFLCLTSRAYPSPDNYKINMSETQTSFPKYSIPNAVKPQEEVDQNSRYMYKPSDKKCKPEYPQYSFGYAQQRSYSTQVPPPNNYFQEQYEKQRFNKTQNYFGKMNRPDPYGQKIKFPGVGQYDVASELNKTAFKFGEGNRPDGILAKSSPGIYYHIAGNMKSNGANGKTIGKLIPIYQNKDTPDFPAANHYNPGYLKSRKSIISYRGNRSQMHTSAVLKNPSSDKYAAHTDFAQTTKNKSQSFAKSERPSPRREQSPAPNEHDVSKIDKHYNVTGDLMGRKLKQLKKFITPAGANYKPSQILTKPQYQRVITYDSDRIDFSKSITGKKVGPGSYLRQPNWKTSQKGKMDVSEKLLLKDNKIPGPGSYQISGTIGKLPKYYRLPRKIQSNGDVNENLNINPEIIQQNERMKKFTSTLQNFSPKKSKSVMQKTNASPKKINKQQ